jgi:penicillin-binding protein 1A
MALGVASITPIELATTYTTFATLGTRAMPRFIIRVEDQAGRILWEPKVETHPGVMDPRVAYITTDIMRDVVDHGTGYPVRETGYNGVAAGKTGTTNDATDAWFIGFTPEVVADVWIGYDTPSPLGSAGTGGVMAAPVWGRVMRRYYAKRPPAPEWTMPEGVVSRNVDPSTGLVLEQDCTPEYGEPRREVFLADHIPDADCPSQSWLGNFVDQIGGKLRDILGVPVSPARPDTIEGDPRDQQRDERRQADEARRRQDEMQKFMQKRAEQLEKQRKKDARKGGGGG